jgi:hypothetical protein
VHPESVETYRKHVPQLCKILRSLLMSGSSLSGEHDVGGITDPFLQAKVNTWVAVSRHSCSDYLLKSRDASVMVSPASPNETLLPTCRCCGC